MSAASTTRLSRSSTRTNMVISAAHVLRERGAAGLTIDEVLARSGAPRGSVYHHFPGGRNQILIEALQFAGDSLSTLIDSATAKGAVAILCQFIEAWERVLRDTDFAAGCPVLAAAIGSTDDEPHLTVDAGQIFSRWQVALTRAFVAEGFRTAEAASLAVTAIAAIEGGIVLCRSMRSVEPLHAVAQQIEFLVKARGFVGGFTA